MARVNGSHIEDLVVVPHRPWSLLFSRFVSVAFMVALVVGAFVFGRTDGLQEERVTGAQVTELQAALAESEETITTLRQRLTIVERGSQVDRDAAEQVRQTNRELRDQIATLQQEVRLYREVMAPDENGVGLAIDEFSVASLGGNQYEFLLMMTHAGSDGTWLEGSVGVNIIGQNEEGETVVYPLMDVSPDIDRVDIRLRYRYFQDIRGEIEFPEGFAPQQVRIVAQVTGNRAGTREAEIDWDELGDI